MYKSSKLVLWLILVVGFCGNAFAVQKHDVLGQFAGQPVELVLADGRKLDANHRQFLTALVQESDAALNQVGSQSELGQINAARHGVLSTWLFQAISRCETWREATDGRISCRQGALETYWKQQIDELGQAPDRREARRLARDANEAAVQLNDDHAIEFDAAVEWTLASIAASVMLDAVANEVSTLLPGHGFALTHGEARIARGINPEDAWLRSRQSMTGTALVSVTDGAMVSFTPWELQRNVERRRFPGWIDARSGWPAAKHASVVVASSALDAKVYSLLASSVPAQTLFESYVETASSLLLIAEDGRIQTHGPVFAGLATRSDAAAGQLPGLSIDLEIPEINESPYHQPYVSAWISDKQQKPVRNLLLLGDETRWMRELRVWWRRIGRANSSIIDGLSGATRKPGHYTIAWDGLDDFGQPVSDRELILHIEASREHGGRTYKSIPLQLDALPAGKVVERDGELGQINIRVEDAATTVSAR